MAGACAVAAPSPAATSIPGAAPPRLSLRVSYRRSARSGGGRASFSCNANGTEAEPDSKGPIPQDDYSYLWTLGLGSVAGAAAVKYGSVLLTDITQPNIVQALLMGVPAHGSRCPHLAQAEFHGGLKQRGLVS